MSSEAQIEAFGDTWHWNIHAEQTFDETIRSGNTDTAELLRAMRSALGENDLMAYLALMAVRIFGAKQFRSEISWKRASAHNDAKQGRVQYGNVRDVILLPR